MDVKFKHAKCSYMTGS